MGLTLHSVVGEPIAPLVSYKCFRENLITFVRMTIQLQIFTADYWAEVHEVCDELALCRICVRS